MADAAVRILSVFRRTDRDGNGYLTTEDLLEVLTELAPGKWNKEKVDKLVMAIDTNRDGVIQYEEFIAFLFGKDSTWHGARKSLANEGGNYRANGLKIVKPAEILPDIEDATGRRVPDGHGRMIVFFEVDGVLNTTNKVRPPSIDEEKDKEEVRTNQILGAKAIEESPDLETETDGSDRWSARLSKPCLKQLRLVLASFDEKGEEDSEADRQKDHEEHEKGEEDSVADRQKDHEEHKDQDHEVHEDHEDKKDHDDDEYHEDSADHAEHEGHDDQKCDGTQEDSVSQRSRVRLVLTSTWRLSEEQTSFIRRALAEAGIPEKLFFGTTACVAGASRGEEVLHFLGELAVLHIDVAAWIVLDSNEDNLKALPKVHQVHTQGDTGFCDEVACQARSSLASQDMAWSSLRGLEGPRYPAYFELDPKKKTDRKSIGDSSSKGPPSTDGALEVQRRLSSKAGVTGDVSAARRRKSVSSPSPIVSRQPSLSRVRTVSTELPSRQESKSSSSSPQRPSRRASVFQASGDAEMPRSRQSSSRRMSVMVGESPQRPPSSSMLSRRKSVAVVEPSRRLSSKSRGSERLSSTKE